jgi:hypothetical protein
MIKSSMLFPGNKNENDESGDGSLTHPYDLRDLMTSIPPLNRKNNQTYSLTHNLAVLYNVKCEGGIICQEFMIYAFCLMSNHVHLLINEGEDKD